MAFALVCLLVVATAFGASLAALIAAGVAAMTAYALHARYRHDVREADAAVPVHRERLDLIVAGDARAAIGIGLVVSAFDQAFVDRQREVVGAAVEAATIPLVVVATTIYLSSLMDWYITLPRISGLLGARPCRPATGEPRTFPSTWRETTRWWYIHRIVAAVVLPFGLSYAVALALSDLLGLGVEARLLGSAAVFVFAAYRGALPWAVREAGHPRLIVGQTVRHRRTRRKPLFEIRLGRRTLRFPGWKREFIGRSQREYVYDVSVEGVQLVPVRDRESRAPIPPGEVEYERNPRRIRLRDVDAADPARPFTGCAKTCSGINWYCIENPRCFAPK